MIDKGAADTARTVVAEMTTNFAQAAQKSVDDFVAAGKSIIGAASAEPAKAQGPRAKK